MVLVHWSSGGGGRGGEFRARAECCAVNTTVPDFRRLRFNCQAVTFPNTSQSALRAATGLSSMPSSDTDGPQTRVGRSADSGGP